MPLVVLDDYPRWLKKQHEILDQIKDAVPITATFQFAVAELHDLGQQQADDTLAEDRDRARERHRVRAGLHRVRHRLRG